MSEPTLSPGFVVSRWRALARIFSRGHWILLIGILIGLIAAAQVMRGADNPAAVEASPVRFQAQVVYRPAAESPTPTMLLPTPIFSPTEASVLADVMLSESDCLARSSSGVGVNIRSGPNLDFDVVGALPGDEARRIVARTIDNWYRIEAESGAGWLAGGVITRSGGCGAVPQIKGRVCRVSSAANVTANIRSRPGTTYPILRTLQQGDLLMSDAHDGFGWYRVLLGAEYGWVSHQVIQMEGGCDPLPVIDLTQIKR